MNIHEYQAKQVLAKYGVPILGGKVAYTSEEALKAAQDLGGNLWVVKAQIHAGGRGKAGGVKLATTHREVKDIAHALLGKALVTHQTGPKGQVVQRVYVEAGCAVARELYISFVIDRGCGRVSVIASQAGGMDIEEVAAKTPEKIIRFAIDPVTGFQPYHGRKLAFGLGLNGVQLKEAGHFFANLYRSFVETDASLLEINPMVVTEEGKLVALDAKMSFDENALFRQPGIVELRDIEEENPMEREASQYELNYIKLDGTIGCMVNGAGLAMATMDIIKLYGAEPANFLDVGGGATRERVTAAFKIILSDPNVQGILVNIFGGIMRCDVIADGIVAAAREVNLHVPLVVRLEGTNVELGKEILSKSGLPIISAHNLATAAEAVVKAVREGR